MGEVVDLSTAVCQPRLKYILEVDWSGNLPNLKLLHLGHMMLGNVALCHSYGLPLIRLWKGARKFCIIHIGMLSEGSSNLDISLLPAHMFCRVLCLAAKSYTNFDKMLRIRDKFPQLSQVYIFTSTFIDEEMIDKVGLVVGFCEVRHLQQLKDRIC